LKLEACSTNIKVKQARNSRSISEKVKHGHY
jgi:hypothetical protein